MNSCVKLTTLASIIALGVSAFSSAAWADPPTFTSTPTNVIALATGTDGATVDFAVPGATDDHGAPDVGCDSSPGDTFSIGITVVTCTATDPVTNEGATETFQVRVLATPKEQVATGALRALLYYTPIQTSYGLPDYKNIRLVILRSGKISYQSAVGHYPGRFATVWPAGAGQHNTMKFRDLDGDGQPELLVDLYMGGAHCCTWTDVYRSASGSWSVSRHLWGDPTYQLIPQKGGRGLDFLTGDDSFAYAFTDYADSLFPVQIWRYRSGVFTNVTRSYPSRIRSDAARNWHYATLMHRQGSSDRGAYAAWLADECLLGSCPPAYTHIEALGSAALTGTYGENDSVAHYLQTLRSFLRKNGYWR